jgi:hypothetical protein
MKKEMSETLVRTGPGTRMGNLLRRYWVPILLSREIAGLDIRSRPLTFQTNQDAVMSQRLVLQLERVPCLPQ